MELKKRYIYSFLFGLPGFFASLIVSFFIFGAAAGVLWLFVFGDNPWPSRTGNLLLFLYAVTFLAVWIAFMAWGYLIGRKLEAEPGFNKKHVLVSSGLALLLIALITLHQVSVGNALVKTRSAQCSDFCKQNGFAASGTPPKDSGKSSCSCYDSEGHEVMNVTTGWQ
jgi:hypothetical protein